MNDDIPSSWRILRLRHTVDLLLSEHFVELLVRTSSLFCNLRPGSSASASTAVAYCSWSTDK